MNIIRAKRKKKNHHKKIDRGGDRSGQQCRSRGDGVRRGEEFGSFRPVFGRACVRGRKMVVADGMTGPQFWQRSG